MAQRRLQIVLNLDTGAYTGRLAAAGGQMRKFAGDVSSAGKTVDGMGSAFNRLGNHLDGPRNKLRDYVMILGNLHFALLNVQTVMVGWVAALIKQSAEVERLTVLMKGLSSATTETGKNDEARKNMRMLFDLARQSGMAVTALSDSFVKLKSAGIDPFKGSLNSLTNAVAYFGGTSDIMHRASIAIQQMAGKGVISMEELRQQLGEAVPTAMADMSRAMGMSIAEFSKIVSKGKVQAKPALELMFREFELMYAGSGNRMANTLNGQMAEFKTNITELSTYFSGLTMGDSPERRAYIEEQRQMFEQGKISAAEYNEAIKPQAGLFQGVTTAMRQLNQAMRSDEGRRFMQDLGAGVNWVLEALVSTVTFIARWRTELGSAIMAVVAGFGAWKALQMVGWFWNLGAAATSAFRAMITNAGAVHPALTGLVQKTNDHYNALTRLQNIQQLRMQSTAREITQANQQMGQYIAQGNAERARAGIIQRNIALVEAQRAAEVKALATAEKRHAYNLAAGRASVNSAAKVVAAEAAVARSSASLIRLRAQQRAATAAAAAADRALAVASTTAAAAQGRMNLMTQASTVALRVKTVAAQATAASVRLLGIASNMLLGPLGMVAIALYAAGSAAGVFTTQADAAAAAADRLANAIGNLADVEAARDRIKKIDEEIEENKDMAGGWGINYHKGDKWWHNGINFGTNAQRRQNRERLQKERDQLSNNLRLNAGTAYAQEGGRIIDPYLRGRELDRARRGQDYQTFVRNTNAQYGEGSAKSRSLIDAKRTELMSANKRYDEAFIGRLESDRAAAVAQGKSTIVLDSMITKYREAAGATMDLTTSQEEYRQAALGGGEASDKAGKKAKKGMSDAEKEAKKAATAAESAREKFENMFANAAGQAAQLKDELEGGQGAFAKFEAQVANGKFSEFSKEQIADLGVAFKEIDRLQAELDFKRTFDRMGKDLTQAKTEADRLWASLQNGTYVAEQSAIAIDSQFADAFDGVTDPEKLAKIRQRIEEIKTAAAQTNAADVMNQWQDAIDEINISLMDEDAAREANFQREMARQRALIDMSRLSAEQRAQAEQRFQQYVEAQRKKMAREQEGATVKMLRDWAKLGANMDAALAGALDNFVNALAEGKASFGDFAKEIIASLVKVILKALIAYAILSALNMTNGASLGSFIKGGISDFGGGFGGGGAGAGGATGGGVSSETMAGINNLGSSITGKYHTGGWIGMPPLKPGEIPLIGQEGEVMLTEEHQKAYANALNSRGGMPDVTINFVNNSGQQLTAEKGEPRFDGKGMIIDVVVEAMNKQGPLRDNLERMMSK